MLGQSQEFLADHEILVIMDPVIIWRCSQKNIGMGGESRRRMGESSSEKGSPPGQAVDMGSLDAGVPKTAEPVGPEGIHRDEEDIEPSLSCSSASRLSCGEQRTEEQQDEYGDRAFLERAGYFVQTHLMEFNALAPAVTCVDHPPKV